MMLATRVRLACSVAAAAVVAIGLLASRERRPADMDTAQETARVEKPVRQWDRCGEVRRSNDTITVYLHEPAEWTGIEIESDWAKTFRMVWDGPIQTWTTMRFVRVPSLDHRMIESIEPLSTRAHDGVLRLRAKVRVVVPGDLDAALAWIQTNPAVVSAEVSLAD